MSIKIDPSCMDDYDPGSISTNQARQRIIDVTTPITGIEKLNIRAALHRVLAQDLSSPVNVPSHRNSAMDGYALAASDLPPEGTKELTVVGNSFAGHPFSQSLSHGECVRIMTGATMPDDSDTVIIQEQAEVTSKQTIRIDSRHKPGQNVRAAGEDIQQGETVLRTGHRITAADLGLLASIGIAEVKVFRKVRVAFFSTGDELRSIGEPLRKGEIYDSNRYTLFGMLTDLGVDMIDMGVIKDVSEDTEAAFQQAADNADVIITSGGVSVGEADFVKAGLNKLGKINFWKVAMKPGRPLAFGSIENAWFFGLPGNPVSVMATFYLFVQPALRHLMGERIVEPIIYHAKVASKLRKKAGRTEYQRGLLSLDESGELIVDKTGAQGSGILTSMSQANCFIVLPMEYESVNPGDSVPVIPFSEFRI